jgi:hypothetical protein
MLHETRDMTKLLHRAGLGDYSVGLNLYSGQNNPKYA